MPAKKPTTGESPPSTTRVRRSLGQAVVAWDAFLDPAKKRTSEWKRYSPKYPWALRVFEGKRTVLWLVPGEGVLEVTVILGEKAVAAGLAGPLSQRLKNDLRKATPYPEGRLVRFRMKTPARVKDVECLVDLKVGRAK